MKSRTAVARKRINTTPEKQPGGTWTWLTKQSVILGTLLAIATLVVYLPVDHHPFVNYDDMVYVVNNSHIQSGLDWDTISWAFSTFYQFNWHPLTWISHALDVQMFQLEPAGHHVTNLLLQIINVLLLYWVMMRATGYVGRSAMVAGLFALHPMNVESVAWVSERKNLLSMMFFLLGMGAYRWYATARASGDAASEKPGVSPTGRYVLMALCFAMGLMSKPQIITFPFILLLWDCWPLQRLSPAGSGLRSGTVTEPISPPRTFWWLVKEKIPLFAMCAGSAIVTVIAQKSGGAVVSLETYPFPIRLTNAIVAYVRYIGKCFWPTNLIPIYPHPWHTLPMLQVIPALLILLAISALAVAMRRSHRYFLVGWLWFLGALVPMIGLVHVGNQAMADRYAYLPFIGLFLVISWGLGELAEERVPLVVLRSAAAIVLVALAITTHHQLEYWNDNVALWTHAIEASTDNYVAHDNLALLLIERGDTDEAMKHFQQALAIFPADPTSNLQLAVYDHQHGKLQEAIARYDQMISTTPDSPGRAELYSNKGFVYFDLHDAEHAKENFEKATAMDPQNWRGWLGLGALGLLAHDNNAAIDNLQRSVAAKPNEKAYDLLARTYDQMGRRDEAQAAREKAKLLSNEKSSSQVAGAGVLGQ